MEDFGYQKDDSQSHFPDFLKRGFLVGATLLSIACFIYVTINAYYFVYQDKEGDIEVIKSPEGPIKVLEEEKIAESGTDSMQIDRSIYEDIFGTKGGRKEVANAKIQKIIEPAIPPKPAEPDRRLITESLPKTGVENEAKNLGNSKINPQINSKTAAAKSADQKIIVFSETQKKENSEKEIQKEKPAQDLLTKTNGKAKEEKPVVAKPAAKSEKRAVRVQVAAMTSKAAADEAWGKLNHLYPDLFSGLKPFTQDVNLGKRGIFYRLQIGNFYNQVEAEEFCNRYVTQTKKSHADCIVVE